MIGHGERMTVNQQDMQPVKDVEQNSNTQSIK